MSDQPQHQFATNVEEQPANQPAAIVDSAADEDKAWELYVRGYGYYQISQFASRPLDWVKLTINRLLEQHENCCEPQVRGQLAKLLDEVNLIRQAAWSGWNRSLNDKVRIVEKTKESGGRGGNEQTKTTESRSGDTAPLRILIECSKRESALRGIERPTTVSVQQMPRPLDLDALIQRVEALKAEDRRRQDAANVLHTPNPAQENRS